MTRKLAILALVLWAVTAAAAGWLFVKGRTRPAEDGRTAVLMAPADRDFVLAEMRGLLTAVQSVAAAESKGDHAASAAAARAAGMAAARGAPPGVMASLPAEFKLMGMSVHQAFDGLATSAEAGEPLDWQMGKLGAAMQTCVACHQLYRLEATR